MSRVRRDQRARRLALHALAMRLRVLPRGETEEPAVLPAELRGALIADAHGCTADVEGLHNEQAAGFVESELFLVLQRAHGSDRVELMVQR